MDPWGSSLYGEPCRECGFTWTASLASMVSYVGELPDSIDEVVADATGTEHLARLGWNVSAYVAHMTDNLRIWAERLIAVARGADPHVAAYDDNLLGEARRYNEIALAGARWSLRAAIAGWMVAVDEAVAREVVMIHAVRGQMEVRDVVASNAHDAHHRRWDITQILNSGVVTPHKGEP